MKMIEVVVVISCFALPHCAMLRINGGVREALLGIKTGDGGGPEPNSSSSAAPKASVSFVLPGPEGVERR